MSPRPARLRLPRLLRGTPRPEAAAAPTAAPAAAPPAASDPVADALEVLSAVPLADLQARGWHLQRLDYYAAVNDLAFLRANPDLWHGRPLPAGIRWDLDAQLALVREVAPFAAELADVPRRPPAGPPAFHWDNDFWRGLDALMQYGLVRHLKPRRVVEVGCGWSSLLLARAVVANEAEGRPAAVAQVEPYPRHELLSALPASWTLHETTLQRAPLDLFDELEAGDVLFYDGSHVARAGSDVNWFLFEVLPRLAPGVVVHVHDLFWPDDYPDEWVFERGQTWNEQYALQAFLMYNEAFEPLVANHALHRLRGEELARIHPDPPDGLHGVSVWLRRRSPG